MFKLLYFVLSLTAASVLHAAPMACDSLDRWPGWEVMQNRMITHEGRVVDHSNKRSITTSEGQSYAMFFALVDNDRELFQKLFHWTEQQLADGDLSAHLPAWLWGLRDDGNWGILDSNSASDSDLWIAYLLLEAGRLWDVREYTIVGHLLLAQIAEKETTALPGWGDMVLPGPIGFVHENAWTLNPSYVPPHLMQYLNEIKPWAPWLQMSGTVASFLRETSPIGIAPDWVVWQDGWRWENDEKTATGSYDAIRVYLWVGMLDPQAPQASELKAHFRQVQDYIRPSPYPPETFDVLTGQANGRGPVGFSAALLPLFSDTTFGERQRERVAQATLEDLGYYNLMLLLFGQGWDEGRYRFDASGRLVPTWKECE